MNTQQEDIFIDLKPEDLKKLSQTLADTLIQQLTPQTKTENQTLTYVSISGLQIIHEHEITEVIKLNLIASAEAGVLDPLGQLKDWLVSIFNSIASFIVSGIQTFLNNYVLPAVAAVTSAVTGFINQYVMPALNSIGGAITGFINALLKFPEWFPKWFMDSIATPIANAIGGIANVLWEKVTGFAKWVADSAVSLANTIWNALTTFADFMVKSLQKIANWLIDALKGLWTFLTEAVSNAFSAVWNALLTVADVLKRGIEAILNTILDIISTTTAKLYSSVLTPLFVNQAKGLGIKSPAEFSEQYIQTQTLGFVGTAIILLSYPILGQVVIRALTWHSKSIATFIENLVLEQCLNYFPIGVGGGTRFDLARAVGGAVRDFIWNLERYLDTLTRGLVYGFAIWFSQPLAKALNLWWRNFIPIRLPLESYALEFSRRTLPTSEGDEIVKIAKYYMQLEGYSDFMLDRFFQKPEETPDEFKLNVRDRFGVTRQVPLSLIYELPSASDVATMMVRDIFATIKDFQAIYHARGMHPEIGMLYYFLRFRYPPPEKLWQYTTRGISGLLWATLTPEDLKTISPEAEATGAYTPISSADLNFQAEKLLTTFKTYMKWHDYFRCSWIKDFTSDNQIYIDTLADIPTKIDQRWMIKWGIYELLSSKGITLQSPIWDFNVKTIETTPASEIKMDLTNFSRTIQATGLHPDWVPLTAVAEAMNTLAEERTAIRTGFTNLFKEGFYSTEALDTLLAGFIITSFQVAYFDTDKLGWTTGWLNLPVIYLPPERRLIELKALTDRAMDILREIQRDVSVAYQEYIIWDYNEYKSTLSKVITSINEFYTTDYQKITGVNLPDELKLQFVEDYYRPYVDALKIWREVFTIRRVRMWTQRWLGWVMYRVAYGVVRKEDIANLITYVSTKAKLTSYETEFIRQVMELMYGIAKQSTVAEYLPTPSTLATLSEYMTLDETTVKTILTERGLPEQWTKIWLTYITVKPIKADAKALLSTYVRALRYAVITKDTLDAYIRTLPQYGFTEREINLIKESVNLEEQIIQLRQEGAQYIPTPLMLTTLSEYIIIPTEQIDKIFKARNIPADWQPLWRTYIDARPLADDIKGLISTYRRALLYVEIPDTTVKQVKEYAKIINFSDREFAVLDLRNSLEEMILQSREYIPTPASLATISEIVPEAREYFDEVMTARKVPAKWQAVWGKYVDYKPVMGEVNKMLGRVESLYEYFAIEEADYKKVLDTVKYLGWTDQEIEFMLNTSRYQRYLRAYRELIGDIDRMVAVSQYSSKAEEYALGTLNKMIDAMPIDQATKDTLKTMWEQYIRNRHVKDEVITYVRDLVNLYIAQQLPKTDLEKELITLEQWGLGKYEREFWLKIADARLAKKLKIPVYYAE